MTLTQTQIDLPAPAPPQTARPPVVRRAPRTEPGDVPAFSPRVWQVFSWYVRRYLRRHFHAVRIARDGVPQTLDGLPVVVYMNHPSWWDPMLAIAAADVLFAGRRHAAPMDADALAKYRIFEKIGVFGIEPGTTRGAARFLRRSLSILAQPDHMLWITAEGRFTDARTRPVRLRPGLAHLARRMDRGVLLPLAIEYAFWNERSPEALLRFGEPIDARRLRDVAGAQHRLETSLEQTMNDLAAMSLRREADRFGTLVDGVTGVGGVYDLWRRLRAAAHGRRFDGSHGLG